MTSFSLGFSRESAREIFHTGEGHGFICASTGGMKTSGLVTVNGFLQNDASKLFVDGKDNEVTSILGEYLARLGPYYAFSPYGLVGGVPPGVRANAKYNPMSPLFDGRTTVMRRESVARVNSDGCIDPPVSGKDAFFVNDARRVFTVIQLALAKYGEPHEKNIPEVARIVEGPFPDFCERIVKLEDAEMSPIFRSYLRHIEIGTRGFGDVLETIKSETAFLSDRAIAKSLSGSDFRFSWLTERMMTIAICMPFNMVGVNSKLFRLMVACALDELMRSEAYL